MYGDLKILTGTANPQLALDICDHLGCSLTPSLCETFSDGEIRIEIGASVRGHDVFVIQPTCAPANYNFMQLCLMLDALKRASASRITAVIPYYGYARQDRKVSPRAPISAKVTADFLSMAGAQRIVTMDLHAGQIQGFFNCPVDNLYASPVLLQQFRHLRGDIVMVSPDAGGVERARAFAKMMDASLAVIDKRRDRPNQVAEMNVIGDVQGKVAILVDDMIDTAGNHLRGGGGAASERGGGSARLRHARRAVRPCLSAPYRCSLRGSGHHRHHSSRRPRRQVRQAACGVCSRYSGQEHPQYP